MMQCPGCLQAACRWACVWALLHDLSSVGLYLAGHQLGPMQRAQHAVQELLGLLWSQSLQLTAVHGAKQAQVDVTGCRSKAKLALLTVEQWKLLASHTAAGGALHTCRPLRMHFQGACRSIQWLIDTKTVRRQAAACPACVTCEQELRVYLPGRGH